MAIRVKPKSAIRTEHTQIAVYYCPFHARAAFFPESCRRNHLAVARYAFAGFANNLLGTNTTLT